MRLVRAAAIAFICASVAACTSAAPTTRSLPSPTETTPAFGGTSQLSLPLDPFKESIENSLVIGEATDILVAKCMKSFGFNRPSKKPDLARALASKAEGNSRIFGISDLSQAKKNGYHLDEGLNSRTGGSGVAQSPAEMLVFDGTKPGEVPPDIATKSPGNYGGRTIPPGGCIGQARTAIFGSAVFLSQFTLAKELATTAANSAEADARVLAQIKGWSTCMKSAGLNYPDPYSINDFNLDTPRPSAREIQVAIADVECKEKTQLAKTWLKVLAEYEKTALEKNQLTLAEQLRQRQDVVNRATLIIGSS